MKHIFFVHSHITYFVSEGVILYERINKLDCIFLLDRGYKVFDCSLLAYEFPFLTYPEQFVPRRKFWKGLKQLRLLDQFLSYISSGDDFFIYFPETEYSFFDLVVTNSNCAGFSIIEEGLAAYWCKSAFEKLNPPTHRKFQEIMLGNLNFPGRFLRAKYFFNPKYNKIYGISELSFPGYERKVSITWPDLLKNNSLPVCLQPMHIIVFDAVVEYSIIQEDLFLFALHRFLQALSSRSVTLYHYKFHPQQYSTPEFTYKIKKKFTEFQSNLNFIELTSEISLESIAMNENATFYVNISSVGLYAALFGCAVYSYALFLTASNPDYQRKIQNLPKAFYEKIIFLDPTDHFL